MATSKRGTWATIRRIAASDRISGLIMLGFALAGLLLANLPFTLIVIAPANVALLALGAGQAGAASRALIERWGALHAVRAGLSVLATAAFALAIARAQPHSALRK